MFQQSGIRMKKFLALIIVYVLGALIPVLNTTQLSFGAERLNMTRLNHKIVVNGIVEENNTALGYIAIYNPDIQQYGQEKQNAFIHQLNPAEMFHRKMKQAVHSLLQGTAEKTLH